LKWDRFMADVHRQQSPQTGNGAAEVVRRGAAAAHTMVEATQQAMSPSAEAGQQAGAELFRKAANPVSREPAAATEHVQATTQSLWAASQDFWRTLPGQATLPANSLELPQAFAGLFSDMVRANLKIGQELFRLANPMALIELQQTLARSYLNTIASSQSVLLGTACGIADEALRQSDKARHTDPQGR
jgi:hypothetical protein